MLGQHMDIKIIAVIVLVLVIGILVGYLTRPPALPPEKPVHPTIIQIRDEALNGILARTREMNQAQSSAHRRHEELLDARQEPEVLHAKYEAQLLRGDLDALQVYYALPFDQRQEFLQLMIDLARGQVDRERYLRERRTLTTGLPRFFFLLQERAPIYMENFVPIGTERSTLLSGNSTGFDSADQNPVLADAKRFVHLSDSEIRTYAFKAAQAVEQEVSKGRSAPWKEVEQQLTLRFAPHTVKEIMDLARSFLKPT